MVGTIRRPVQETTDNGNSDAPPPPSYQAAIAPTARVPSSSSSGNINAGAFQQQRQPSNIRHSVAVTGNEYTRPLSQAQSPARPQSYAYAQPSGAPPAPRAPSRQQSQYQQPPGPPPRRAPSNASTHAPAPVSAPAAGSSSGGLQRSNTQEDRLAVCTSGHTSLLGTAAFNSFLE